MRQSMHDIEAFELFSANTVFYTSSFKKDSAILMQKYLCGNEGTHTSRYDHKKPNMVLCIFVSICDHGNGSVDVVLVRRGTENRFVCFGPFAIHEIGSRGPIREELKQWILSDKEKKESIVEENAEMVGGGDE